MNTATNQSHNNYRTNNIGHNNMYILKIPILLKEEVGSAGYSYRQKSIAINLDHFVYAYPTTINVYRILLEEKDGWKTIDGELPVNEVMLTKYYSGGAVLTTVDIHSSIDWILHSGPGFYDLTK